MRLIVFWLSLFGIVVLGGDTSRAAERDALPPLAGEWLEELSDAHGEIGFVTIPLGSTNARPLVVALHGAMDHPGMACAEWRGMFGPVPFIVCPHGEKAGSKTYVWGDPKRLRAAIDRAVAAAEARYPQRIDRASAIWASYSQSGMLSAHALALPGMSFRYAALFEGVPRDVRPLRSAFQRAGIRRALFANQQGSWTARHRAAADALAPDIEAKQLLIGDGTWGHFLRGETMDRMREALPWLTAGDPAWISSK